MSRTLEGSRFSTGPAIVPSACCFVVICLITNLQECAFLQGFIFNFCLHKGEKTYYGLDQMHFWQLLTGSELIWLTKGLIWFNKSQQGFTGMTHRCWDLTLLFPPATLGTKKSLSSRHDKSCLNVLNAKERCFSASFRISFSMDYPQERKGYNAVPQFLSATTFKATHHLEKTWNTFSRVIPNNKNGHPRLLVVFVQTLFFFNLIIQNISSI